MRVLITGGAGFLGSHLARRLVAGGHKVILFDNFASAIQQDWRGLEQHPTLIAGDILDLSHLIRVVKEHSVQRIVHTAAIVGVPASLERPLYTARVNIEGSLNVFEAARLLAVERVVDISSEEVYGAFTADTVTEDHPQNPISPYGITKAAVERFGNHYARHYDLPYVAVRLSWVYGPGFPRPRIPRSWVEDALLGRRTVLRKGGDHRIDFTYVDDAVEGLRLVLEAPSLEHNAYNVASGQAPTLLGLAAQLRELIPSWEYEIGPGLLEQVPGWIAPRKGALDISRISRELNYRPVYDLKTGLSLYLKSVQRDLGVGNP